MIPRRLLFGPAEHAAPALSPDGELLAFLAPTDGVTSIRVGPPGGPYTPIAATAGSISAFHWCEDSRRLLFEADRDGDENWHLHVVDAVTGRSRNLTPFDGVQALLVAMSSECPDAVLVALNRDDPRRHDVHRLCLSTGESTRVARDEGFGTIGGTWLADRALTVRAALRPTADGGVEVLVRDGPEAGWSVALRGGRDDDIATRLLGVDADGRALYLVTSVAPGADTAALCRLDLDTGHLEVRHRDPAHDVAAVLLDPERGEPFAAVVEGARDRQFPLDEVAATVLADPAFVADGGWAAAIVGCDRSRRRHLVRRVDPRSPVRWYLHDAELPAGERVRVLFDDRPALLGHRLPERRPFDLPARDGLALRGYLTVPAAEPPWPTVLLVHGGPWARDRWRLDPDAAWLADRGYLVVQVNFRGSTGCGTRFVGAGDGEWGAAMHDDLLDTVAHAVRQGWAAPDRIAIMGGSYGGYAALVGATRSPEMFCCAVDLCGPSDLRTLLAGIPPYWESLRALWTARVGHPERDVELLAQRSPLTRAGEIRMPLFIAQGVNDPRVPRREAEQLVAALVAAGVEHEYLPLPGGHLTFEPDVELLLVSRIEQFLAQHLGGRFEPIGG